MLTLGGVDINLELQYSINLLRHFNKMSKNFLRYFLRSMKNKFELVIITIIFTNFLSTFYEEWTETVYFWSIQYVFGRMGPMHKSALHNTI